MTVEVVRNPEEPDDEGKHQEDERDLPHRFVHYSIVRHLDVRSVDPTGWGDRFKPRGLWISDENDFGWSEWCATDAPDMLAENAFAIELVADARLLWVRTANELVEFDAAFRAAGDYSPNWEAVASDYQGIVITPYQWSLRLSDLRWYYGWDCASGCIWDASAVKSACPLDAHLELL